MRQYEQAEFSSILSSHLTAETSTVVFTEPEVSGWHKSYQFAVLDGMLL